MQQFFNYYKANRFYNQSILARQTSQNYILKTGHNIEKEARELNRKEDKDI
jgi:hypothetical protein